MGWHISLNFSMAGLSMAVLVFVALVIQFPRGKKKIWKFFHPAAARAERNRALFDKLDRVLDQLKAQGWPVRVEKKKTCPHWSWFIYKCHVPINDSNLVVKLMSHRRGYSSEGLNGYHVSFETPTYHRAFHMTLHAEAARLKLPCYISRQQFEKEDEAELARFLERVASGLDFWATAGPEIQFSRG